MSSRRRIRVPRRNGRKSRAPVAPQGTARSDRNTVRHGLLARCLVLETEAPAFFDDLAASYFARFQPVDEVEAGLVEEMIAATWRLRRCWALETRTLDHAIAEELDGSALDRLAEGFAKSVDSTPLPLVHRYESRLQMMHQRAFNSLVRLRAGNFPNEPNPISEQLIALARAVPFPPPPAASAPADPAPAPAQSAAAPPPLPIHPPPVPPASPLPPSAPLHSEPNAVFSPQLPGDFRPSDAPERGLEHPLNACYKGD